MSDGATYLAGIDPGAATGYALVDPDAPRLVVCTALSFWDAATQLCQDAPSIAAVVIEDARSVGLYGRYRHLKGRRRDAAARSVGQIDAQTRLWGALCERLGLPVLFERPTRQKWTASFLRRLTGYQGPTNEHGRDAARLVWGRTAAQVLLLADHGARAQDRSFDAGGGTDLADCLRANTLPD